MTLRKRAAWYAKRLKADKRDDGATFYKFECGNDTAAQLRCQSLSFAAHGDMLPDDHRYEMIHEALEALAAADEPDEADVEADIYAHDLLAWLASRLDRMAYCDRAAEEGIVGPDATMSDRITAGQYLEKREVLDLVRQHLETEEG